VSSFTFKTKDSMRRTGARTAACPFTVWFFHALSYVGFSGVKTKLHLSIRG